MKHVAIAVLVAFLVLAAPVAENFAQRGGRGGFGGRGGGFTSPARPTSYGSYSGGSSSTLPAGGLSGSGPGGGTWHAGSTSGSHTTSGGATITWKGAGAGGTTGSGVSGGRYVGGVKVTTPDGKTVVKGGTGGAVSGPSGATAGGRTSITHATGPGGTGTSVTRGGFMVGPGGSAVAGSRTIAATPHGTYYRSTTAIHGQGIHVRTHCVAYHGCFTRAWITQYPAAWYPGRWAAATAWTAVTWAVLSSGAAYPAEPVSYDYGSSVVYQDDSVYVNGDVVGSTQEYAQQASAIADAGKQAPAAKEDDWMPLGVFAMVQGEQESSSNIFQLAVNKAGVIRGNYYNALTDTTEPVFGSVDKKNQRAAWTVGDKKTPTYEAGIANLTKDETTMMIHYSKDRSQQFSLYRLEQNDEQLKESDK